MGDACGRLPDGMSSDRLARIELQPATPSPDAEDVLGLVRERRTDRRRFTSRPVTEEILHNLARLADSGGAHALPVLDAPTVPPGPLADRARDHQARDERIAREQQTWVDHGPTDGIPWRSCPPPTRPRPSCGTSDSPLDGFRSRMPSSRPPTA